MCVSVMCVHSIIHIVWGWVVIEMCLVVVLVLCVFIWSVILECGGSIYASFKIECGCFIIGDSYGEVRGVCEVGLLVVCGVVS